MNVRREDIESGVIEAMIIEAERQGIIRRTTPEERKRSRAAIVAGFPAGADIWLFGYGSLMWNPMVRHHEVRAATLYGYHRRFCLEVAGGRGSPERPGLMLGLVPGGSCRGLAFRIAGTDVETELEVVWNREMVAGAYKPRIVDLHGAEGIFRAVTFVVDRAFERYTGRLPAEKVAEIIAAAEGYLGRCSDYLFSTEEVLARHGLADRHIAHLAGLVRSRIGD